MDHAGKVIEQQLLQLVRQFIRELRSDSEAHIVTVESHIDKDLALGSLERVELLMRIEQHFNRHLPEDLLLNANTISDLLTSLLQAQVRAGAQLHVQRELVNVVTQIPTAALTFVDVLKFHAEADPLLPHIYLQLESGGEDIITYGALFSAASHIASGLAARGVRQSDTVAIILPTSRDFFVSFFGVLLAGAVPVPLYPPFRLNRLEDYAQREAGILQNAQAQILITNQQMSALASLLKPFVPTLKEVVTTTELMASPLQLPTLTLQPRSPALIQYTSGSTGNPKGVYLTHANLLANVRAYGEAAHINQKDVVVSWLPLYHDMGLIGAWLGSFYYGIPLVVMSPLSFLAAPERWLWAIHTHRGTLSAAPNFGYELCVRRINQDLLSGLDLSSWRLAANGSEAVNPGTLRRFIAKFSEFGFHAEALQAVYGLAESSVGLCIPPLQRPARIDYIDRDIFTMQHRAQPVSPMDLSALQFLSVGVPLPGHEIRIVDTDNHDVPERIEGQLQFRGPSVSSGYFNAPEKTAAVLHDGWWDSEDLAYWADGEIFITGRRKDLIIKAGRNLYPQELEEIASEVPGVRKGCVIAFGVTVPQLGTENIVLIVETREQDQQRLDEIHKNIVDKIVSVVGVPPDVVQCVPPGTIPKTSSGKLRRASCRDKFLNHQLVPESRQSVWLSVIKLWLRGLLPRVQGLFSFVKNIIYTIYVYLMVVVVTLPTWLIVRFCTKNARQVARVSHYWARTLLKVIGATPTVTGQIPDNMQPPLMVIANHESYLDAIALIAVLPIDIAIVVKHELKRAPIIGLFIEKQQHIAVDRENIAQGIDEAQMIEQNLSQGRSVFIFPEGKIGSSMGILPFKLGAFKAAVATKTVICPIALEGTRQFLRPDQWLIRKRPITVTFLEPLVPTSQEWHEMTRLRNEARTAIARQCKEPMID
jgi:fatty-acyl-CoA synthase